MTDPARLGSNAAQIKHDIDSGLTGDKAPGFDPAAAPLGTDEEAGGVSLPPDQLAAVRQAERAGRPAVHRPNAVDPRLTPDGVAPSRGLLTGVLIGFAAAAVFAAGLLLAL